MRRPAHLLFPGAASEAQVEVIYGEVTEWSKVHAWKACVAQVTEGSNPSLSAI